MGIFVLVQYKFNAILKLQKKMKMYVGWGSSMGEWCAIKIG